MEQLVDFLNHGTLPFIGRHAETERIVEFWRGTYNAQELRAALVIGEAGLGKSRLIAESIPRIADAGGIVIHVRLYPESMASVVPLIARELWYSPNVRALLKNEPEATVSDVTAALRRLARLRPTLLIIDDIHLVDGESLQEFSLLLNSLAEETLSLLCTARPVELPARAPLERFLVDQIRLAGLSSLEISSLWTGLLSSAPDPEIVAPLAELTGGNPLALRSALRGAIKNETLVRDTATNSWRSSISPEAFGAAMRRNVGRITEGMVSHLTEEEKSAARMLASLGEIFSREMAGAVIEDAAAMIGILMFKGIIASSDSVVPSLSGNNSRHPLLVFTHSLLHQHLLDTWTGSPLAHARATASGLPIYSIVPLQILDRLNNEIRLTPDELVALIRQITEMAIMRTIVHDWTGCNDIMAVAESIFRTFDTLWNADQRIDLRMRLLNTELNLRVQLADTEEFQSLIARQLELTSGLESETMGLYHLLALRFLYATTARRNYEECGGIWDRVEQLLVAFPCYIGSLPHLLFLRDAAQGAWRIPDIVMLRRIEARLRSLLDAGNISAELLPTAQELVATQLINLFDGAEELEARQRFLRELPHSAFERDPALLLRKLEFLEETGWIDEVLAVRADTWRNYLDLGLVRNAFPFIIVRLRAEVAAGADLVAIERRLFEFERNVLARGIPGSARAAEVFRRNAAISLSEAGALRGDLEWVHQLMETIAPGEPLYWPEVEIMRGVADGRLGEIIAIIPEEESCHAALKILSRFIVGDAEISRDSAVAQARTLLLRPVLRIDDLLVTHAVLAILRSPAAPRADIGDAIAGGITIALNWLAEHSIAAYMTPFLDNHGDHFSKKDLAMWRARAREIAKRRIANRPVKPGDHRLRITMLGTIAAGGPGAEPQPLRGSRIRMMLGLLVAARMLPEPLSNREFCRIGAGGEMDIDLARKTTNMGIVRLREAIGGDAIITGEETHELDLANVQVDLLDACNDLREANQAMKMRTPMRAYPPVLRALEITDGEVPFPGLYDDFFEALRSDFETSLRATVVALAMLLLRENDYESSERLLRRAFNAMPEDEEIAELLQQALVGLGKRADAERVRMKALDAIEL